MHDLFFTKMYVSATYDAVDVLSDEKLIYDIDLSCRQRVVILKNKLCKTIHILVDVLSDEKLIQNISLSRRQRVIFINSQSYKTIYIAVNALHSYKINFLQRPNPPTTHQPHSRFIFSKQYTPVSR